jgi:hypothetical protein
MELMVLRAAWVRRMLLKGEKVGYFKKSRLANQLRILGR